MPSISEVLKSIHSEAGAVIHAAENWSPIYRKDKKSFKAINQAMTDLEDNLKKYFEGLPSRAARMVNWPDYQKRVGEIRAGQDDFTVDLDEIQWDNEADLFMSAVYDPLLKGTTAGYTAGPKTYDIPAGNPMQGALQLAAAKQAGNLVGMKYENGRWIPNPDARFHVMDTTRQEINNSIQTSLKLGETYQQAQDRLSFLDDESRASMIARTESVRSYQSGITSFGQDTGAISQTWQVAADPCAVCAPLDGMTVGIDEDFDGMQPGDPHPNCVIGSTKVLTDEIKLATGRAYKGTIIEIVTASGNFLSVTPNHPVLTANGWVAAGMLDKGSNVVSCLDPQRITSAINPDNHHIPTRIEEIFVAFGRSAAVPTRTVPVAPVDFHGDGLGSDVCVVRPNSKLGNTGNTSLFQPFFKQKLQWAGSKLSYLAGLGALGLLRERVFATTDSFVSRLRPQTLFFRGAFGNHQLIGFTHRAHLNPTFFKESGDNVSGRSKLFSKLRDRLPGEVFLDNVVSIKQVPFSGHVYNLETNLGWYIANSIVTHNCMCGKVLNYPDGGDTSDIPD